MVAEYLDRIKIRVRHWSWDFTMATSGSKNGAYFYIYLKTKRKKNPKTYSVWRVDVSMKDCGGGVHVTAGAHRSPPTAPGRR